MIAKSTDKEIWREIPDDYYAASIHVTESGGVGINVGGTVIVRTAQEWHKLASPCIITANDAAWRAVVAAKDTEIILLREALNDIAAKARAALEACK